MAIQNCKKFTKLYKITIFKNGTDTVHMVSDKGAVQL